MIEQAKGKGPETLILTVEEFHAFVDKLESFKELEERVNEEDCVGLSADKGVTLKCFRQAQSLTLKVTSHDV